jgi:hypothetical protein
MPPKTAKDTRPRIWAEGRQNPPLEPRAFALASVAFARESLSGLLVRCAASAEGFGAEVGAGHWRVPAERLGRTGRFLPSVEACSRAILGGGAVLSQAARTVNPALVEAPKSIFTAAPAHPATMGPVVETPAPGPAVRHPAPVPSRLSTPDDPDLEAIRALIGEAEPEPVVAARRPAPPVAEPPQTPVKAPLPEPGWRRQWLAHVAGAALGYGLLVLAVPVGAGLALMAHLNGEDLRRVGEPS